MTVGGPRIKLNNGREIPAIGLGTWQSKPGEVAEAVAYAIKEAGYRHIDCAWAYGNEKEVGEGIKASGVPRSEVFVTSKLWGTYHSRVEECLDQSLTNLGLDYLDLYLIHWPVPMNPKGSHPVFPLLPNGKRDVDHSWPLSETWKQMEAVLKKGKVKSIGVSNFSQNKLEEILPSAEIVPVVNQLELHIYNPQLKLISYLKEKGIVPQAYSPLGSSNSPLLSDETVLRLAQKYSLKPADVLLGYLNAKGIVVLPKSVTPARIASNFTGAISAAEKMQSEDVQSLDALAAAGKQKRFITPPWRSCISLTKSKTRKLMATSLSTAVDLGFENWPPLV